MIEIIEKPWVACRVCGCQFSFEKEDFKEDKKFIERKEYGLNRFINLYNIHVLVGCPICGIDREIYSYIEGEEE